MYDRQVRQMCLHTLVITVLSGLWLGDPEFQVGYIVSYRPA